MLLLFIYLFIYLFIITIIYLERSVCRCSSVNGKAAAAPLPPPVPAVLSAVPPLPPPPPVPVSSSFTRLDAGSTDIKHEPKSPMPPDNVGGPAGVGLNLSGSGGGSGGGGVDPSSTGGGVFSETGMACNGHTPRYGGLVTPAAQPDVTSRCPAAVAPSLLEDDDAHVDGQPPTKRLHFVESNGWSP